MKYTSLIILCLAIICSFGFDSSFRSENSEALNNTAVKECCSLKTAICHANNSVTSDSIFLSTLQDNFQPDQYLISDHIILINDLGTIKDLWSSNIQFAVEQSGHLELVGFDLKNLESILTNYGSISLVDCVFQEGRDLTRSIRNQGEFSISHGVFDGGPEGQVIRDAVFKTGAYIIL